MSYDTHSVSLKRRWMIWALRFQRPGACGPYGMGSMEHAGLAKNLGVQNYTAFAMDRNDSLERRIIDASPEMIEAAWDNQMRRVCTNFQRISQRDGDKQSYVLDPRQVAEINEKCSFWLEPVDDRPAEWPE